MMIFMSMSVTGREKDTVIMSYWYMMNIHSTQLSNLARKWSNS